MALNWKYFKEKPENKSHSVESIIESIEKKQILTLVQLDNLIGFFSEPNYLNKTTDHIELFGHLIKGFSYEYKKIPELQKKIKELEEKIKDIDNHIREVKKKKYVTSEKEKIQDMIDITPKNNTATLQELGKKKDNISNKSFDIEEEYYEMERKKPANEKSDIEEKIKSLSNMAMRIKPLMLNLPSADWHKIPLSILGDSEVIKMLLEIYPRSFLYTPAFAKLGCNPDLIEKIIRLTSEDFRRDLCWYLPPSSEARKKISKTIKAYNPPLVTDDGQEIKQNPLSSPSS